MTNCYSILVDEASVWSIPRLACPCGLCSCLIDEIFGRHSVNCQFDNQSEALFNIIGSSELAMEIEEDNILGHLVLEDNIIRCSVACVLEKSSSGLLSVAPLRPSVVVQSANGAGSQMEIPTAEQEGTNDGEEVV